MFLSFFILILSTIFISFVVFEFNYYIFNNLYFVLSSIHLIIYYLLSCFYSIIYCLLSCFYLIIYCLLSCFYLIIYCLLSCFYLIIFSYLNFKIIWSDKISTSKIFNYWKEIWSYKKGNRKYYIRRKIEIMFTIL